MCIGISSRPLARTIGGTIESDAIVRDDALEPEEATDEDADLGDAGKKKDGWVDPDFDP